MVTAETHSSHLPAVDHEQALKLKFAEALLRYTDPYKAALKVTYNNTQAALAILSRWHYSAEIAQLQEQLKEEFGEEHFLPSEVELQKEMIDRARSAPDDSDYAKIMALVLDSRGMTSKAKASPSVVINNNQTNNKIMQVPVMVNALGAPASDEEWEASLIDQQQRLTNGI